MIDWYSQYLCCWVCVRNRERQTDRQRDGQGEEVLWMQIPKPGHQPAKSTEAPDHKC